MKAEKARAVRSQASDIEQIQHVIHKDWAESLWTVPGLFTHDQGYYNMYDIVKERYNFHIPMEVYGSLPVLWHGGRGIHNIQQATRDKQPIVGTSRADQAADFDYILKGYKARNIDVFYTWSNWLIEEKHLSDPTCNLLLDKLWEINGDKSGVIVVSDILFDYIKNRYPDLKLKASIDKTVKEKKAGDEKWYRSLAERYDVVNIHTDDGHNLPLLEKLADDADKYEIILNEMCEVNCPYRRQEHLMFSQEAMSINETGQADPQHKEYYDKLIKPNCYPINFSSESHTDRSTEFRLEEVKRIYDMGYRRFKLQGRQMNWVELAYSATRFMFDDFVVSDLFIGLLPPRQ